MNIEEKYHQIFKCLRGFSSMAKPTNGFNSAFGKITRVNSKGITIGKGEDAVTLEYAQIHKFVVAEEFVEISYYNFTY